MTHQHREPRTCPLTGHPIPDDRYASPTAVHTLRTLLVDLPGRMDDLTAAITRQLRFTSQYRHGGRSATTPLPVNMAASDAGYVARQTILTWTDTIAQHRHEATPDTWAEVGRFLDVRAAWLATIPEGPDAISELTHALTTAIRAVDRPADRHYAGPCTATTTDHHGLAVDCDGELYAHPGKTTVACPRCDAEYAVADRRAWLLEQSWDVLATGPDIARALAGDAYGKITVNLSTLRSWALSGRLERRGTHNGRPVYRLGDVVALATGIAPASGRITA